MWNIGFGELAIICIVLIIAVGPDRLPSMMKTVGKTVRTLRQASRDLRESTGIDELLREDFDYHPPPRRPAPVASIARDAEPVMNPVASPMAPLNDTTAAPLPVDPAVLAASEAMAASTSLPSDAPLTAATETPAQPAAAAPIAAPLTNVGATLPSDAPLAAKAPAISVPPPAGPASVPPPPPAAPAPDDSKSRES